MKIFELFFGDWEPIWTRNAIWNLTDSLFGWTFIENCYYEVQYSKKLDRYRLITGGYRAKSHKFYATAVDKFREIIKNGY